MNSAGESTGSGGRTAGAVSRTDDQERPVQESAFDESPASDEGLPMGETLPFDQGSRRRAGASGQHVDSGDHDEPRFREKLHAPLSYWFIGLLFGISLAIIMLVVSPWWSLIALVVGTALSEWAVVAYGNQLIEIGADGVLRAGSATLPASALGPAVALDAERARALRTHEADPRAFLLLRSYVATAVRVEIADPADPTPYLYLSSRRPKQLAAVVNALPR